jgi:hypothetical protein
VNNEFRCSSTFKQEVFNFADLALRHPFTRALEDGVSRYAVQRRLRAARADLEALFDDLALNLGWKEQRLASARALYTGVVRAQGRKIIFSTNLPNAGDLDDALLRPDRCFAHMIALRCFARRAGACSPRSAPATNKSTRKRSMPPCRTERHARSPISTRRFRK